MSGLPYFPRGAQPEISTVLQHCGVARELKSDAVRASQKDSYYLADLREQAENVARNLLGKPNRCL